MLLTLAFGLLHAPLWAEHSLADDRVLRVQDGAEARQYAVTDLIAAIGLTELRVAKDPHFGPDRVFAGFALKPLLNHVGLGDAAELLRLSGPGVIYELRLKLENPRSLRASDEPLTDLLDLELTWDGASRPQVSVPVGALFACPDAEQDVAGFWCGCLQGTYYTYLPMPFARSARLGGYNRAARAMTVTIQTAYRRENLRPSDCHLAAHRYDIASPRPGSDNLLFQRRGAGHVVGVVMDHPGHMEGDDRWFLDGQPAPSIHGTGT